MRLDARRVDAAITRFDILRYDRGGACQPAVHIVAGVLHTALSLDLDKKASLNDTGLVVVARVVGAPRAVLNYCALLALLKLAQASLWFAVPLRMRISWLQSCL